jgi:hypothetical protein
MGLLAGAGRPGMISAEWAALPPGRLALFYGLYWARRRGDKIIRFY